MDCISDKFKVRSSHIWPGDSYFFKQETLHTFIIQALAMLRRGSEEWEESLQVNRPWIEAWGENSWYYEDWSLWGLGCEWEQFQDWFDDLKDMNVTVRILGCLAKKSPLLQTPDFVAKMCCWVISFLSQRSQYSQYTLFIVPRIYLAILPTPTTNQNTSPWSNSSNIYASHPTTRNKAKTKKPSPQTQANIEPTTSLLQDSIKQTAGTHLIAHSVAAQHTLQQTNIVHERFLVHGREALKIGLYSFFNQ